MDSRITVNGKELQDKVKLLLSFFTPSKIYYYGNYTQVKVKDNLIIFTQSQIVGEAINTGLLEVALKGLSNSVNDFKSIMVPTEELKKIVNQIPIDSVEMVLKDNSLQLLSVDKDITIPVADSEIPKKLLDNHELVKQAELEPFNIKEINKAIAEVNHATKGVIVSYDNQAVFIENDSVIVNKGVRITRHYTETPLGLRNSLYTPFYMIPVLKHLEEQTTLIGRYTTPVGEELVLLKGNDFSIHFQEWYSKAQFPLDSINQILSKEENFIDTPDYLHTLGELSTADKVLNINPTQGQVSTRDNKIVVDVSVIQAPQVYISTEIMPKKAELKKYKSIVITDNIVKFIGENDITVVATMEES